MTPDELLPQDDPLIGRVFCGCKVLRLIGQGGMGNVYEARQLSLDRIISLKVLAPSLVANAEFLGRFRREARSLANLIHPNIVAVHDFGTEHELYGIVMEFVPGESVADMLERTNVIPLPSAIDIIRQVAEGLAFAHRHQIIHCDLKPENVLVTPEGVAKVVDFGLARSVRGDAVRVTQDGAILGTPPYMSPEQCEGAKLDARTDIYSLGATFYRMVAGRDVFEGDNAFAVMLKHKTECPVSPRDLNPEVPVAVATIILRMLEKSPADRYQAADEIATDLATALDHGSPQAPDREPLEDPRRNLAFVRDALEAGLVTIAQVREMLSFQDQLRKVGVDESLPVLMAKRGLIGEELLAELRERAEARETSRKDEQLTHIVVQSGMVSTEEVARCLEGYQGRARRGSSVKLSTIMVEQGILDQRQLVRILLHQLKEAQRRDDEDFLELVRDKQVITTTQIQQCRREQERHEAEGHHKILRQLAVDLGFVPRPVVRDLLYEKVRAEIDQALAQAEAGQAGPGAAIVFDEDALKLTDTEPCPACGGPARVGLRNCPTCGADIEQARRKAARLGLAGDGEPVASAVHRAAQVVDSLRRPAPQAPAAPPVGLAAGAPAPAPSRKGERPAGEWEFRLSSGEPSKPVRFDVLIKLAKDKRLHPQTVLRGPLTRGVWRQARHTPTLCRIFGLCHYCEKPISPRAVACPSCGCPLDRPPDDR